MMPAKMAGILLSIAGFDPSGGAGALLDVAIFETAGFRGMSVLTALTVQNSREVRDVLPLPASAVRAQFDALASDVAFRGVKVGMLGSLENLAALGRILARIRGVPVVIDPVLKSSSGADLLPVAAAGLFLKTCRRKASLITPNLDEAEALSGLRVRTREEMLAAARAVFDESGIPCLVKGGHLPENPANILWDGRKASVFESPSSPKDVHGTGCFLSSSILARLARKASLARACAESTEAAREAIRRASRPGRGRFLIEPLP